MKRIATYFVLAFALTLAQSISHAVLAQQTTPTGFYYPTGSNQHTSDSSCGFFLSTGRSMNPRGCYIISDMYHNGYDISADQWTPVRLISPGIVKAISYNGWTCGGTNNAAVLVKHRTSTGLDFIAIYGHMMKDYLQVRVDSNKVLPAGTIIGYVGTYCGGNHLHFGVYVPQWNGGAAMPPFKDTGVSRTSIGYGRIGASYWAQTFGWAHPINFIEFFAYPGTPSTGTVSPDQQAKTDMKLYMQQHTPYGSNPVESGFGSDLNWSTDFELRWMPFGYSFNGSQYYLYVYHATYKANRSMRWVGYHDPITSFWQGWYYVGQ